MRVRLNGALTGGYTRSLSLERVFYRKKQMFPAISISMKTADKSRRFAFHHQNETLLFQFLLHECICAHHILRDNPSREMLRYMIGNVDREENIWQPQYGHVPRLRYYCTLFTTHFGDPASPLTEQLDQTVERAYHAALQCRSLREKDEASLTVL